MDNTHITKITERLAEANIVDNGTANATEVPTATATPNEGNNTVQTTNQNVTVSSENPNFWLPPQIRAIDDAVRQCMTNSPDFMGLKFYTCPTSGKLTVGFEGGHKIGPDHKDQTEYHNTVRLKVLKRARRLKNEYRKLNPLSRAGTHMQHIRAPAGDASDIPGDTPEEKPAPAKKGFGSLPVELKLMIFELIAAPPPCKHFHDSIDRQRKRNGQSMAVAIQRSPAIAFMEDRWLWTLCKASRHVMVKAYNRWHWHMLAIGEIETNPTDPFANPDADLDADQDVDAALVAYDALHLTCIGGRDSSKHLFSAQMVELCDDGKKRWELDPTVEEEVSADCNGAGVSFYRTLQRPWTSSVMDNRLFQWPATESDVPDNEEERHWLSLANFNNEYNWTVRELMDDSRDETIEKEICPTGVVKLREMRQTARRLVNWTAEDVSK